MGNMQPKVVAINGASVGKGQPHFLILFTSSKENFVQQQTLTSFMTRLTYDGLKNGSVYLHRLEGLN